MYMPSEAERESGWGPRGLGDMSPMLLESLLLRLTPIEMLRDRRDRCLGSRSWGQEGRGGSVRAQGRVWVGVRQVCTLKY